MNDDNQGQSSKTQKPWYYSSILYGWIIWFLVTFFVRFTNSDVQMVKTMLGFAVPNILLVAGVFRPKTHWFIRLVHVGILVFVLPFTVMAGCFSYAVPNKTVNEFMVGNHRCEEVKVGFLSGELREVYPLLPGVDLYRVLYSGKSYSDYHILEDKAIVVAPGSQYSETIRFW